MTTAHLSESEIESVVRRYFAVVSDLTSTEEDLLPLLSESVSVIEHPNAITPQGAERGLAETLAGFLAGKALLRDQCFDLAEVITSGDRAAVRATWSGTIGVDAGPYRAGLRLRAEVAALLTVRDGKVVRHETFDCYEPFELSATS
jgi:ketosteroid isomerase-like protein